MTYTEQIQNAYATLELDFGATEAQVNSAYKELTKKYHPDLAANQNDPEEQERLNHLQAELNNARKTLLDHFVIEASKSQVTPEQEAKAKTLMYNAIFKNEIDKTTALIPQAQDSIEQLILDFSPKSIKNTEPLFNDIKKLVAKQKEIINKYSALVTPILASMQTKNIKELDRCINDFDYLCKLTNETLPNIYALINDAVEIPSKTEPTLKIICNALSDKLKYLNDSVKNNGPSSIKDENVGRFLDVYISFFNGEIHDALPGEINFQLSKKFDLKTYNFIKLIYLINEKLPFNRSFNDKKVENLNDAIDYLIDNIDAHVKDLLIKNHDANFKHSTDYYRVEFHTILHSITEQHAQALKILDYSKNGFSKLLDEVSFFFNLAKRHNEYYFLKDYKFENNRNSLELLENIKKYTYNLVEQYTTSIFSKQNNDTPSAIDDPIKFSESIKKFVADSALLDDNYTIHDYRSVGHGINDIAYNIPTLTFIKNNFSGHYLEDVFKDESFLGASLIYNYIENLSANVLTYVAKNADEAGKEIDPEELREFIDSVSDFTNKVENFEITSEDRNYFMHKDRFFKIRHFLETAEEMERMMKLPHYNEVYKQIYNRFSPQYPPGRKDLITKVTENIDKFYQKLLIKALFDKNKTLTKADEQFLEFSKEYFAYVDKTVDYSDFKIAYKSANYILETLQKLKDSGINIKNTKEVEKFVADSFNKSIYEFPDSIIKLAKATYGEPAAKKIANMLLEPSLKYDVEHPNEYYPLSLKIVWTHAIPPKETTTIINKYKDNLDAEIIKRINETSKLNIQPTPKTTPAPAQVLKR
ncbi:MAG: J domain-containing protein [Clostridiales bacterium]|jgi:hypothetical protein|nr:J domain-containing protein [Clostridiales bacterium]